MHKFLVFIAALLLFCHQTSADEFPYTPPPNFTLNYEYIALHHPVSTKSAEAQLYFDQGLTLLYAFNHDAAYWSFLKASEADPHLAMAYWGMALVLGKNINFRNDPEREKKAYQHYLKAQELQNTVSANERAYIATLFKRYGQNANPDFDQESLAYSQAMRSLHESYPDDPDAAVLFAESLFDLDPWHQWTNAGKPLKDTPEAVKILESVLKKFPHHLGANHYYIHAVEGSLHPEWALPCADRLRHMLPASGHILHMPSHIYFLLGDYRQAALSNEAAAAVDRAYVQKYGVEGIYPVHYLSHNLFFLSRAYAMEGNYGKAKQAAEELESFYLPHFDRMPTLEVYASAILLVQLRFHRWEEILKSKEPDQKMPMMHVLWLYAQAQAHLGQGHLAEAIDAQKRFEQDVAKLPKDYNFGYNPAANLTAIAAALLKAKLLEFQGDKEAASQKLAEAVQMQDTLKYDEPPDWYFPIRESLGGLLLRSGKYAEAEKVFREDLQHHPRNGRSLFGLKEALKAQSRLNDLYWVQNEFQTAWLYSDTQLTLSQL